MAIEIKLPKELNHLNIDFDKAYWVIQDIGMRIDLDNQVRYGFTLNVYANKYSKECTDKHKENVDVFKGIGYSFVPVSTRDNNILYQWRFIDTPTIIFPQGIPISRDQQLTSCYEYLKQRLELKPNEYLNV